MFRISPSSLFVIALGLFVPGRALAEGPGCTKDDLNRASNSAPGDAIDRRTKAVLARIEECRGKLTQMEEANALQDLLAYYSVRRFEDMESCLSLAERGLHLDLDRVGSAGNYIAESYGRCGGDCSKVTSPGSRTICEKNHKKLLAMREAEASAEIKAQSGKLPEQVELEQPVECDPKKARKLVAGMDQRGFHRQGIGFIRKYWDTCGARMSSEFKEALTNDEALLNFHRDDDAACVKALSGLVPPVSNSTAWNRALCGDPCTLDAAKCTSVLAARKKAVGERAMRAKRQQITQSLCWDCKPGMPCKPPTKGNRPIRAGIALGWDLKSARNVGGGEVSRPYPLHWTGDLNGDGIGDVVTIRRDKTNLYQYLSGREAWDGERKDRIIPYKIFDVRIGCGLNNEFKDVWSEETAREPYAPRPGDEPGKTLDGFELRIEKKPHTDLPSVCIYSTDPVCTTPSCQEPPIQCLDLSKWEEVGRSPIR